VRSGQHQSSGGEGGRSNAGQWRQDTLNCLGGTCQAARNTLQKLCQIEADRAHSQESTRNDHILLARLPSMYCTCLRCTALAFDVLLQYIEGCGFHLTALRSLRTRMQTATSETESTFYDLSICVHHYTLRAPCLKGRGVIIIIPRLE